MNARAGPPDIQGHVVLIVDDNPNNLRVMSDLLRKAPEAQTLGSKDVLLAKVVLDIHRKRTRSEFVCVPLFMVKQIHPIDRDIAIEATEKRIEAVRTHRQRILGQGVITREILGKVLPSVSWIKVVQQDPETYIAYEGN